MQNRLILKKNQNSYFQSAVATLNFKFLLIAGYYFFTRRPLNLPAL